MILSLIKVNNCCSLSSIVHCRPVTPDYTSSMRYEHHFIDSPNVMLIIQWDISSWSLKLSDAKKRHPNFILMNNIPISVALPCSPSLRTFADPEFSHSFSLLSALFCYVQNHEEPSVLKCLSKLPQVHLWKSFCSVVDFWLWKQQQD